MKRNAEKPKFYQYGLKNILQFDMTSGQAIKYENCLGLIDVSTGGMSAQLYDNNANQILSVSGPDKWSGLPSGFCVQTEFDQVQVSYVSAFNVGDNKPYYMKSAEVNNKNVLSGTQIVVRTYDIVNRS